MEAQRRVANRTTTLQRGVPLVCTWMPAVDVKTHLAHSQLKKRGVYRVRSNEDGQQVTSDNDSAGKAAKRDNRSAEERQRKRRSWRRQWYFQASSASVQSAERRFSL